MEPEAKSLASGRSIITAAADLGRSQALQLFHTCKVRTMYVLNVFEAKCMYMFTMIIVVITLQALY